MNHKRAKALKAELIEILGTSPTQTQWRAWKKRREIMKSPFRFFETPKIKIESEMKITHLLEEEAKEPRRRKSVWERIWNFVRSFLHT